jgi:hypothetical protein
MIEFICEVLLSVTVDLVLRGIWKLLVGVETVAREFRSWF